MPTEANSIEVVNRLIALGAKEAPLVKAALDSYALVPSGFTLMDVSTVAEAALPHPRRKVATVDFFDAQSFIKYFNDHKNDGASQIFANPEAQTFRAILDYHGVTEERAAGWCRHRANFALERTPEWAAWLSFDGRAMDQNAFAEHLENHRLDILKPSSAAIIDVCRMLSIKREVSFSSGISLSNGTVQFQFSETDKGSVGTGDVAVPEEFTLRVSPYIGTEPRDIIARLRYRLKEGKLSLFYDLHRKDQIATAAFESAVKSISEATGTTVLLGIVKGE